MPRDGFNAETGEVLTERRKPIFVMPPEVAKAVRDVALKIKRLGVDEKNNFQSYSFVSIDKFLEFVGPVMAEAGIFFLMNETEHEVRDGVNDKGSKVTVLFLRWDIFVVHESGAAAGPFPRSVIVQGAMAQAFGSAQSYVWKQFARGIFAIPTGDKDDPDLHANDVVPAPRQQPQQTARNGYQPQASQKAAGPRQEAKAPLPATMAQPQAQSAPATSNGASSTPPAQAPLASGELSPDQQRARDEYRRLFKEFRGIDATDPHQAEMILTEMEQTEESTLAFIEKHNLRAGKQLRDGIARDHEVFRAKMNDANNGDYDVENIP